jgi:hypothetical protein
MYSPPDLSNAAIAAELANIMTLLDELDLELTDDD